MSEEETLFDLPSDPEGFGVLLPSPDLRKLDFSALEFSTLRRVLIEYIKTYYKDEFNDFVKHNGVIMLAELISYVGGNLSMRSDVLANASFLATADDEEAVIQHLKLIGQDVLRAIPAIIDIELALNNRAQSSVTIAVPVTFPIAGPDNQIVTYELFRAPGDFTSPIIIPPGKRGIIAYGIEGKFGDPIISISPGGANQIVEIPFSDVIDEPITVDIQSSGGVSVPWVRVPIKEKAVAADKIFEVRFTERVTQILFGDDIAGAAPLSGQQIIVNFRRGGGIRGRIQESGTINTTRSVIADAPANAAVEVTFRNIGPSRGGFDKEDISTAKKRAPREFATHGFVSTDSDYAQKIENFSHPVFGTVFKAAATVRTSLNANLVELYVLQAGADGQPVTPSKGLKDGIANNIEEVNVLTDFVRVFDGAIKAVDVEATIIMNRSADASVIKEQVVKIVDDFFDASNFDMGQGLYLSKLYASIQNVDGIQFVDVFSPADDIIPTKQIADTSSNGVGFNELIVLGEKNLKFYFEQGAFR